MERGQGRITIRDVAVAAHVSTSTVSLVLRGSPKIPQATRARVIEAMRSLGYTYNRGAANLRRGRSHSVALIVDHFANPYFAELSAAVTDGLAEAGQLVFMAESRDDPERQTLLVRSMLEHGVGGIIICPAIETDAETYETLAERRLPCVLVIRSAPAGGFDYVGLDNRASTALAVRHLVAAGHRRIAWIGGDPASPTNREREEGFTAALQEAGLGHGPEIRVSVRPSYASGGEVVDRLLRLDPPPTALVAFNDFVALSAMRGLRRHGLEPGTDVAVVGIDDIPVSRLSHPRLTTIAMPAEEVGRKAAALMLRRMKEPAAAVRTEIVRPSLVRRESA